MSDVPLWTLAELTPLFPSYAVVALPYRQRLRPDSTVQFKMLKVWSDRFLGHLAQYASQANSVTIEGTVSPSIFFKYMTEMHKEWLQLSRDDSGLSQLLSAMFFSVDGQLEDDGCPLTKVHAILIAYDLYSATRVSAFRTYYLHYRELDPAAILGPYLDHYPQLKDMSDRIRLAAQPVREHHARSGLDQPYDTLFEIAAQNFATLATSEIVEKVLALDDTHAHDFLKRVHNRINRANAQHLTGFVELTCKYISKLLGIADREEFFDKLLNQSVLNQVAPFIRVLEFSMADDAIGRIPSGALKAMETIGLTGLVKKLQGGIEARMNFERQVDDLRRQLAEQRQEIEDLRGQRDGGARPGPAVRNWDSVNQKDVDVFQLFRERRMQFTVDGNALDVSNTLKLQNLTDAQYEWAEDDAYWSSEMNGSYLVLDFGQANRVKMSGYSITSTKMGVFGPHLMSWSIMGTNERGSNWFDIDIQREVEKLNEEGGKFESRQLPQAPPGYRFIRLKQIEANWAGTFALSIANITIFGKVETTDILKWRASSS
jgi:hypothetical protein